jgi:hypothetical protein
VLPFAIFIKYWFVEEKTMPNKRSHQHTLIFVSVTLVISVLACQLPGSSTQPPTLTVISPPQGTQINLGDILEVVYHAEDEQGVTRVEMSLDGSLAAAQEAPVPQGQTPLEGILRWTPEAAGTYNLLLIAFNADETASAPAGVSITVVEAETPSETVTESETETAAASPTPEPTTLPEPTPTEEPQGEATAHLPFYRLFDFDQGTRLSALDAFPDFFLGMNDNGDYQIEADTGYEGVEPQLVIWGNEEPSYQNCIEAALAIDPIVLDHNTPNGTYVCMRTGEGLYGYMRLDGLLLDSEVGERALDVTYVIWNYTGTERITPPSLHTSALSNVDDGVGHDLDFRTNSQTEDLSFQILGDEVEIMPLGAASLALWGSSFPSKADCESHSLNSQSIRVSKSDESGENYFCFMTDQGRLGRLQFSGVEEDADDLAFFYNTDIPQINFGYDTWE